jgi:hypothetical protein
LISGLHTFYSKNDLIYKNVLPPLSILNSNEEKELIDNLEKLNFSTKPIMAGLDMQLARFLNSVFKKDGFILESADAKNYIIGSPKSDRPIKIKILDKKLHYKLLLHPDFIFWRSLY